MHRTLAFAATLLFLSEALAQQDVRITTIGPGETLAPAVEVRLDGLRSGADGAFRATPTADGRVRVLVGGRTRPIEADGDRAARRFVDRQAGLFGVDPAWSRTLERPGAGARAHVRFTLDGLRIDGAGVVLLQDGAAVTGAAASLPPATAPLGRFDISEGVAAGQARAALQALRRERGLPPAVGFVTPRSERRWLAAADGLVPVWAVEESTADHAEAYLFYVDARDGGVARVRDLVDHGGLYPNFGSLVPFGTKEGKGRVFKTVADARAGVATKVDIKHLSTGVPGILAKGYVLSPHADTWDNNGNDAFNTKLKFDFDPFGTSPEYDNFDQVNVVYQAESFYKHVKKSIGQNLATNFALPFLLNIPDANPNAFFSASTFPGGGGHIVGWMGFHETIGEEPFGDLSRDPTVVDHEYTHAWLAFELLSFSGNLDEPSRAVNEAVADFFAVSHHKDTVIGRYADDVFPTLGVARDLQADAHFPETTVFYMQPAETNTGLPEEHGNGEIFGSFLVDVRNALGTKKTEKRLFQGLPLMPRTMADVGIFSVTPANAVASTETFMVACVNGMLSVAGNAKEAGAILGAATGRGLIGGAATTSIADVNLEPQKKRKYTFKSGVHLAGTSQRFLFRTKQGRTLKVTVTGKNGTGVLPTFTVTAVSANPGAVTDVTSLTTSDGGRIAKQTFTLNDPNGSSYEIEVSALSGTTGAYTLKLDA